MKKVYKIICILIIITTIFMISREVKATDFWDKAQEFIEVGVSGKTDLDPLVDMESDSKTKFQEMLDFLWSIGLLTIFISTVILGIKYMLVSPNEKSKVIQATTPYIVGVVIIFGAVTIWKLVIDILNGSL